MFRYADLTVQDAIEELRHALLKWRPGKSHCSLVVIPQDGRFQIGFISYAFCGLIVDSRVREIKKFRCEKAAAKLIATISDRATTALIADFNRQVFQRARDELAAENGEVA